MAFVESFVAGADYLKGLVLLRFVKLRQEIQQVLIRIRCHCAVFKVACRLGIGERDVEASRRGPVSLYTQDHSLRDPHCSKCRLSEMTILDMV